MAKRTWGMKTRWASPRYFVHLDRWIDHDCGFQNELTFKNPTAALRCLKRNPKYGQLDVRRFGRRGCYVRYCWKYWDHGRIVTQDPT